MSGCFDNSKFDKYIERQLDEYLDQFDDELVCEECGYHAFMENWDTLPDDKDRVYCPECNTSLILNN